MKERKGVYNPPCLKANICKNYEEKDCIWNDGSDYKDLIEKLGEKDVILFRREFAFSFLSAAEKSIANGNPYDLKILEICTSKHILDKNGNSIGFAPATQPWTLNLKIGEA